MKTIRIPFLFILSFILIQCAEDATNGQDDKEEDIKKTSINTVVYDTVPVNIVFLKVLGKESMIQNYYQEGLSEAEYIKTEEDDSDFQKLINVDVKGSAFGYKDEEGFIEDETGAIKSKTMVFNMLQIDKLQGDIPFRISVITRVKDFESWKWLYDMEEKNRKNAGMQQLQLGVSMDDPNEVFMLIAIPDIAKAREMMEHPGLKKKMEQSGVIGDPIVKFWRLAGPQSEEL